MTTQQETAQAAQEETAQAALPPVRVTTDGVFIYFVTDPEFLNTVTPLAQETPYEAPMTPYREGNTIGNIVMDASVVGFSQEAIDLIRLSKVISGDVALVMAWESVKGATFSWIGPSTSMLPAWLLTITSETTSFDFSKFQQIPNDVPGYSLWLQLLGLDRLDDMEPDQEEVGLGQLDLGLDRHDEV